MTGTLMETYLGRDAGRRVLGGRIVRGIAEKIDAVVWFSDLRGFTRITDTAPQQVIPMLNDYSDAIISTMHEHSGVIFLRMRREFDPTIVWIEHDVQLVRDLADKFSRCTTARN